MPFNIEGGFNAEGGGGAPPQGFTSIDIVTTSPTSAQVTFSYSDADFTGFEYRLDGGASIDLGLTNPFVIPSLSPSTQYFVEVRPYNSFGIGSWSDAFQFQTQATNVVQSTVCFNGELNELVFSGVINELEFNGKIRTRC